MTNPTPTGHDDTPGDASGCPVCPHRWIDHDAISKRFCSAKIAGGTSGGCACKGA